MASKSDKRAAKQTLSPPAPEVLEKQVLGYDRSRFLSDLEKATRRVRDAASGRQRAPRG